MSQAPPPVLGFNNNVRHRGRVFHIQTEDSGMKTPRIVTHLFADGGHIIKTTRTEYTDIVHRADLPQVVREMMKSQHKAMFSALRAGEYDALLESACGPLPLPESASAALPLPLPAPPAPALPAPVPAPARQPPPMLHRALASADGSSGTQKVAASAAEPAPGSPVKPAAAAQKPAAIPGAALAAALPEQASKAGRSLFGDSLISEKSLDEVILSYLAEDEGSE